MASSARQHDADGIRVALAGEHAQAGIGLAVLGRSVGALADALRAFARISRGEPVRRPGTPSAIDEAATDLRVVDIRPGSVVLVLEPPPAQGEVHAEHLASTTFLGLLDALETGELSEEIIDPLERALAPLGAGGRIDLMRNGQRASVDRARIRRLRREGDAQPERSLRVIGRLRALDLDRTRVVIRTPDGLEWACAYPEHMTSTIIEAINRVVIAFGLGGETSPGRGRIALRELEIVPEAIQTSLFELEPRSILELRAAHGLSEGFEAPSLLPEEASPEEIDAFFEALDAA